MIGWIIVAVAKSDRVLRGHSIMTIEFAIRVGHSIPVTASHCRTREHQRKYGCTDQSEGHRDISSPAITAPPQNGSVLPSPTLALVSCGMVRRVFTARKRPVEFEVLQAPRCIRS